MLLFVEIRGRKTIPVIHYVLVSLALILFFSLLTALSEQLGFNAAYLAASVATIVLISLFTALVVKDKKNVLAGFWTAGPFIRFHLRIAHPERLRLFSRQHRPVPYTGNSDGSG
ncbi:MAG: inner membrane CreD family protein, partial [Bacteroidales bacterium]|nr:inner membrane CreD family protein [Bacteroidales bacterium]